LNKIAQQGASSVGGTPPQAAGISRKPGQTMQQVEGKAVQMLDTPAVGIKCSSFDVMPMYTTLHWGTRSQSMRRMLNGISGTNHNRSNEPTLVISNRKEVRN
jgi:hypothetical protein